ncbi:signal peptide peptidase SppA [Bosea sp. 117]|uniref:signal peptide peptidase SppA n=1 Tax=Bosea sp. 117 TaxID=1125973 RepID=UPI000493BFF3|nr:signal peptide peptidase SppA [Bosea sp. 117]
MAPGNSSIEVDQIVDRRRLRRKLAFWRGLAALVIVGGLVALAAWWSDGLLPRSAPHVARLTIGGLIRNERERLELIDDIGKSGAKAVIVAIDSPGGTVAGSEALYGALRRLSEKKPVVAVVEGMAASGAYIAALGTDHIVAPRNALVGSIGVLFQYPNVTELLKTVGVEVEEIKSSPLKAAPNGFTPTSPEARAAVASLVSDSYDWFKGLVGERRMIAGDKLASAADGRVFTAHQALPLNLVDEIGDERTARAWLAREKGVPESLTIRDWKTKRVGDEFGWLRGATSAVLGGLGLGSVSRLVLDMADGTAQARLDGLLALWHPRAGD